MKLPLAVPVEFSYRSIGAHSAFTFGLAIVCGIGFSLAPALQSTKADVAPTLKEGAGVELRSYRRFGMRNLLVVGQVAGSLMLLLITGFVDPRIREVRRDANEVRRAHDVPDCRSTRCATAIRQRRRKRCLRSFLERLKSVGAVRSVALAEQPPFSIPGGTASLSGSFDANSQTLKSVAREKVGAGYFAASGRAGAGRARVRGSRSAAGSDLWRAP